LKALPRSLGKTDFVQIFNYLKCRNDRLGLLVNMGLDRVHVERLLYAQPEYELVEEWKYWAGQIDGRDREVGTAVRDALRAIYAAHGPGYGEDVLQHLITFELRRRGLRLTANPISKAFFHNCEVDESSLACIVIENRIVLSYTALFDNNQFNINRGKSFLKALGLRWGVAANFGKTQAQFTGLRITL
jgi:GxxExxY protein